jgi:NAD(P)-dependent dehydrogenase (short-subunit alcohol dehydrogenase family)
MRSVEGRSVEGLGVLVTGGGSGLGLVAARHFAALGARVTISGRRAETLALAAEQAGAAHVVGDVTVAADRQAMLDAALSHGGGLDLLINNAGNMLRGPIETLDEGAILGLFHSNVVGAMMLTGLAVPHLAKRRGSVLFVGSSHTRRAFPGASPYAATKAAVQTLTQVLAAELGPQGIRVNCVIPGGVLTEINVRAGVLTAEEAAARFSAMLPMQAIDRPCDAQDIAEAMAYLATADAVTGAILDVDGGLGLGVSRF